MHGEQPTFWFHWVTRERQQRTTIPALRCGPAPDSPVVPLDAANHVQGGEALRAFFSGASPDGLYAKRPVDLAAQDELLAAVDVRMSSDAAAACLGAPQGAPAGQPMGPADAAGPPGPPPAPPCAPPAGDISVEELEAALRRLPRGKAPGNDGLPYELYSALWPELGPRLCAVLNEAYHSPLEAPLPASMRAGRIALIFKGKGADRASPASYRPITLLNSDYKIAASVLASRFAAPLSSVIDSPQTAFLPGRWIGDNVLAHLEEIDYLMAAQEPGVIVFLDLAKAFDRIDRAWLLRSLEALGMPAGARRWVQVMHGGTCATVAYNGWVTAPFPIDSGVFQGSPLFPLLYVAASQPLAAYTRLLAARGAFAAISLPSGSPAPILHQHADDTTVHVRSRADASRVLAGPVSLFCKASGSLIQPTKSQGIEVGALDGGVPFSGQCPLTGVLFVEGNTAIRHLGVLLGRAPLPTPRRGTLPS